MKILIMCEGPNELKSDRGQNDGLIENPQGIAFIHQIPSEILHEAGT